MARSLAESVTIVPQDQRPAREVYAAITQPKLII